MLSTLIRNQNNTTTIQNNSSSESRGEEKNMSSKVTNTNVTQTQNLSEWTWPVVQIPFVRGEFVCLYRFVFMYLCVYVEFM